MTYRDILPQLEGKPGKKQKFKKHNTPKKRKYGRSKRKCRRCGRRSHGIVRQYDLYFCRQCMREVGGRVGFRKYV